MSVASASGRGSPGPFERKIPSGWASRIASADAEPGMTVTLQPISTRWRRMFHFMPKSRATTCGRREPAGSVGPPRRLAGQPTPPLELSM